jgi:hypothetical protein
VGGRAEAVPGVDDGYPLVQGRDLGWLHGFPPLMLHSHGERVEISYGRPHQPYEMANTQLRAEAATDSGVLVDADRLKAAGMTWEDVLSLAGSIVDKRLLWQAMIPSMGYMAFAA